MKSYINRLPKNLLILIALLLSFIMLRSKNEAASIGIIGGADGPTTIFVASKFNPMLTIAIIILIVIGLFKAIKMFLNRDKS